MMDIVERLRSHAVTGLDLEILETEAADEIERLRKVLQEIADKDGWCSAKAVAKRLREAGYVDINTIYKMVEEAADEIEFLRKERNRLREALRKIANEEKDCFPIQTARDALKEGE
jgi:beta-lactamase superfamily II metal-dependent hydrolase